MAARTEAPAGQKRRCLHQELALRVYLLTDRKPCNVDSKRRRAEGVRRWARDADAADTIAAAPNRGGCLPRTCQGLDGNPGVSYILSPHPLDLLGGRRLTVDIRTRRSQRFDKQWIKVKLFTGRARKSQGSLSKSTFLKFSQRKSQTYTRRRSKPLCSHHHFNSHHLMASPVLVMPPPRSTQLPFDFEANADVISI